MSNGGGWSPFLSSSTVDIEENDKYLKREVEMLERAVADQREMRRRELGRLVGCRYWPGPVRPCAQGRRAGGSLEPPAPRLLRPALSFATRPPRTRCQSARRPAKARPSVT